MIKASIKYSQIIFVIAIIIYGITAVNSHGFYHADEHYQIIEFAGLKLGTHNSNELTWEYKSQIRSTIQPTLAYLVFSFQEAIGITNPYNKALWLRLLTAILALCSIRVFVKNTEQFIDNSKLLPAYHVLSYFLWFLPFISVRFSSETWGGLFFLLALSVYFNQYKKPWLIGLLFGLSFLFRYQMGLAFIGFFCWLLVCNKHTWQFYIKLGLGICLVLLLGIAIDSWFYGNFTITVWNYFYVNIIENVAASFGESPWYFYLENILFYPHYFVGTIIYLALATTLIFQPRNVFLWCILSFVTLHSIISHKEIRFLFPLVYLLPIIITLSIHSWNKQLKNQTLKKSIAILFGVLLIITNGIGLLAQSTKGAGMARTTISKFVHETYTNKRLHLIYTSWANPYNPWHKVPMKFYQENNMTDVRIKSLCQLNNSLVNPEKVSLLIIRKVDLNNTKCADFIKQHQFTLVKSSIPSWMQTNSLFNATYQDKNILMLFKYTP